MNEIVLHSVYRNADGIVRKETTFAPKFGSPLDVLWRLQPKLAKTMSTYADGHTVEHFREDRG